MTTPHLIDRLAAEWHANMAASRTALEAAASLTAARIIKNNPLSKFSYGVAGAEQLFDQLQSPSISALKYYAACAINSHRQMRAAGGRSDAWLIRARLFTARALAKHREILNLIAAREDALPDVPTSNLRDALAELTALREKLCK